VPLALSPAALVYLAVAAGALLARVAPRLLGPSPAEQLAAVRRRADRLAERNRPARELHGSVGHALSIVTVQAGAAGRVLDSDLAFARQALSDVAVDPDFSLLGAAINLARLAVLGLTNRGGAWAPNPG